MIPNKPDTQFQPNNIIHNRGTAIVNNTYTQTPQPMYQYDPRVADAPNSGAGISYSVNGRTAWLQQPTSTSNLQWDETAQQFVWDAV